MKLSYIGLMVEDTPTLPVGMLGILKSGNTFVPVNPAFPNNRIHFIINDCNIKVLLTDEINYSRALAIAQTGSVICHVLCIDSTTLEITEKCSFNRNKRNHWEKTRKGNENLVVQDHPCYIIYTSGSTGQPKGVPITHRNLVPLLWWFGNYFGLGEYTSVLHNLSYTFDFGVFEILTTLICGGKMYMLNWKAKGDIAVYVNFIISRRVNTLHTTPVFFSQIAASGRRFPSLEILHLGGEKLTGEIIGQVSKLLSKKCKIYNGYGPTEATINCSIFCITPELRSTAAGWENIPIGRPSDRHKLKIVDKYNRLVPIGVAGELRVAGDGVAAGYLNRPELTADKFDHDLWGYLDYHDKEQTKKVPGKNHTQSCNHASMPSPHYPITPSPHSPIYHTGDLVKWLPDGNIEFLGRIDTQVKIRGFRIELGEIETELIKHPHIRDAVVISRNDRNVGEYLCAYIIPGKEISISALRGSLLEKLPEYMIPSYFVSLEKIPLNVNGKIDRKALPKPKLEEISEAYAPPGNEIEKRLVKIWQEVLEIEKIGINENFFQLGGHSLLAMKLLSMMNTAFNVKVKVIDIFRLGTIKGIAGIIEGLRAAKQPAKDVKTQRMTQSFEPDQVSIFKTGAVKLKKGGYLLYLDMHHILSTDISMDTLQDEFLSLYAGEPLPKLSPGSEEKEERISNRQEIKKYVKTREWKLIALSATTGAALERMTEKVIEYLKENPGITLVDTVYSLKIRKEAGKYRRTAVCSDIRDAVDVLSSANGLSTPNSQRVRTYFATESNRQVIFMFPGLGSQYTNMGLELYQTEPVFGREMDRCFEIVESLLGCNIKDIVYPPHTPFNEGCTGHSPAHTPSDDSLHTAISPLEGHSSQERDTKRLAIDSDRINQVKIALPLQFAFEYALAKLLMKWGIKPSAMIGHSLGEYTAACLSGVFSLDDALRIVTARGQLIQETPPGSMLSIPLSEEDLIPKLNEELFLATINSSSLCVVSGPHEKIKAFAGQLKKDGYECRLLRLSHAGHSKMMDPILKEFEERVKKVVLNKPGIPYISNLTGKWIKDEEASNPGYWAKHLRSTVRFNDGVTELLKNERSIFIEVGPSQSLSTFVKQHRDKKPGQKVVNLVRHPKEKGSDTFHLLNKIADLWLYGQTIDWDQFYSHEKRKEIHFPPGLFEEGHGHEEKNEKDFHKNPIQGIPGNTPARTNGLNPDAAPRNEMEQILVNTWKELFRNKGVGIRDDFFELGGDSLKAVALETIIHKKFNVRVSLTELFKNPSIEKLAQYIDEAKKISYTPLQTPEEKEYYLLSSAQKRIYFLQQMELESVHYNIPYVMTLEGVVEKQKLNDVFTQLIKRHESLRTSFETVKNVPVQRIYNITDFTIEYYYSSDIDEVSPGVETGVQESTGDPIFIIHHKFIRPFDLSQPPLLRVGLIKLADEKHILMVDMHHIVSDGFSIGILIREFMKLYNDERLPDMGIQYRAFSEYQNREMKNESLVNQKKYWLKQFPGKIPVSNLATDFERPGIKSFKGSRLKFYIEREELRELELLASKEEATLFMLLLAIFNVMLYKLTRQEDIVVGTPVAGRIHPDMRDIIGMFVNTLALRNYPGPGKTFIEFFREVKNSTTGALENQGFQFEDLIEQLVVHRDISRNPLFDIMFAIYKLDTPEIKIPGLKLKPLDFGDKISKFDLTFIGKEEKEKLLFTVEYCTKLFKEKTIKKLTRFFKTTVSSVIRNPGGKIGEIEITTGQNTTGIIIDGGKLDQARVKKALKTLIQKYRLMRESLEIGDGEIIQKIHGNFDVQLELFEANTDSIEEILKGEIELKRIEDVHGLDSLSLSPVDLGKKRRARRKI